MLKILLARVRQGHRTIRYPPVVPTLPDRYRGLPAVDSSRCQEGCQACVESCPTAAITAAPGRIALDLGSGVFCSNCSEACPTGAIAFTREFRMATRRREELLFDGRALELAQALDRRMRALFGRSLRLRQVSAGGCNGCEADVNVLSTVVYDLAHFGISFVASPRHADGLLVTGPVTLNMESALLETYEAVPEPKLVIAVGACAISGGPFAGHPEVRNGVTGLLPVDLFVPGCPPHPLTTLDGILRLLGRLESSKH